MKKKMAIIGAALLAVKGEEGKRDGTGEAKIRSMLF